ncbi:MAG: hypothetical protein ACOC5K_04030 [Chloroflexota bacterium]
MGGRQGESGAGDDHERYAQKASRLLEALGRLAKAQEEGYTAEEIQAYREEAERALQELRDCSPGA